MRLLLFELCPQPDLDGPRDVQNRVFGLEVSDLRGDFGRRLARGDGEVNDQ